jgi:hypothetical protein
LHLETEIETKLIKDRNAAVNGGMDYWSVPRVIMVHVMAKE